MPAAQITVVGNVGQDPQLRHTASGATVVSFSVCQSESRKNPDTNAWEDVNSTWFRVSCWRQQADNIAGSIVKGDRVMVTGRLRNRPYEMKDGGGKRDSWEIDADDVAPS